MLKFMNRIISNILAVSIITAIFVAILLGIFGVVIFNKSVNNQARSECAQISKYSVKDGKATVTYPVKDVYENCLEEKGLK